MSLDFHRGSLEAMSSEIELLKPSERTLSQCCKKKSHLMGRQVRAIEQMSSQCWTASRMNECFVCVCVCFQLHHTLQQRALKRTGQVLNMEEISTRLAGLRSTVIAMPGLHADSIGPVSLLSSICSACKLCTLELNSVYVEDSFQHCLC